MRNPRNESLGSGIVEADAPLDGGSERRCVLTGQTGGRDALVRLAISPPDGEGRCVVLPDAMARAPGRGAWIGVSHDELAEALAGGRLKAALSRSFREGRLEIPENLPDLVAAALRKALTERLGLELRSGRLILGSERIAGEARSGAVAALYHASDASDDGARKLDQAWRVGMDREGSGMAGKRLPLDREALSVALRRENVVHLALADARSAERVAVPLGRLQTFIGTGNGTGNTDRAADP